MILVDVHKLIESHLVRAEQGKDIVDIELYLLLTLDTVTEFISVNYIYMVRCYLLSTTFFGKGAFLNEGG